MLAWCPRLRALSLNIHVPEVDEGEEDLYWPFPAPAMAKLSSLTVLELDFAEGFYTLADVVSLTGLVELSITSTMYADMHLVPAALGQLKALRWLHFGSMSPCVLEAGCLELPELQSLCFSCCTVRDAEVLPGVSTLQCLTGIKFSGGLGPLTLDHQLAQLPRLQRMVLSQDSAFELNPPGLLRLPADMGSLRATLLHLDISGHMGTRFPLALTQLVALEHLSANDNDFVTLPTDITVLSRLTELALGRTFVHDKDPFQLRGKHPLNVRVLGDLSVRGRLMRSPLGLLTRLNFDRALSYKVMSVNAQKL